MEISAALNEQAFQQIVTTLPHFDGYPYLTIRLCPAYYQILLLPSSCSRLELSRFAWLHAEINRLKVCLVVGEEECLYFNDPNKPFASRGVPRGGFINDRGLLPSCACPATEEIRNRQGRLREHMRITNENAGINMGDPRKGGVPVTPEQYAKFAGRGAKGIPRGLVCCAECHQWSGLCLDPEPNFAGLLMSVDCLCANNNRCVRCGDLLYHHRLNSNFFCERDGQIWHVPGLCAFSHRCREEKTR